MPTDTVLFDQLNSHTCVNFLRVVIFLSVNSLSRLVTCPPPPAVSEDRSQD